MSKLLFGALLLLASRLVIAQSLDHNLLNAPTPKSPEAAAILKFVDTPVSYFNGSADVTIPIYTLTGQDLSLPISISFSTTGLKVDDVPSWVGYGWNLNATGVIGRTIYDIPDDYANGYLNSSEFFRKDGRPITDSCTNLPEDANFLELFNFVNETINWYQSTNRSVGLNVPGDNYKDTEPDVFTYSTPTGLSGKFVLNLKGEVKMIPKKNAMINMISNGSDDKTFHIFDQNGIEYYFGGNVERVNSSTNCGTSGGSRYGIAPISSWNISMMKSHRTGEQISFGYTPSGAVYTGTPSATKSFVLEKALMDDRAATLDVTCTSETEVEGQQLSTISFRGTTIHFVADTTNRLDIQGSHRLKEIIVMAEGEIVKRFEFYHSYAYSSAYLRLDSIVEFGSNNARLPAYKFSYETIYHYRNDFAQDHWGYYNGAANTTLLPTYQMPFHQINFRGANRESNEAFMKEGSLTKIIYPTGGYTEFEYEANEVIADSISYHEVSALAASYSPPDGHGNLTDYDEFTLADSTWVEIFAADFWESEEGELSAECGVILAGTDNEFSHSVHPSSDGAFIMLPPGTFRLTAYRDPLFSPSPTVYCVLKWNINTLEKYNRKVGGLRLKSIKKFDGLNPEPVLTKRLNYRGANGLSTGKLYTGEHYWYDQDFNNAARCEGNPYICCDENTFLRQRLLKSNNLVGPTEVMGTPIGYSQVTEYVDSTASGKSVYTYRNETNFFTLYDFPQIQNTTLNYKLSLLTNKSDYDAAGNKVKESKTFMRFGEFSNQVDSVYGFQTTLQVESQCPSCRFRFSTYMHFSEPMETDSIAEITYINGQSFVSGTKYLYDTIRAAGIGRERDYYYVLRETRTTNSQGKQWKMNVKYPFDFKTETEMNKLYLINNYTPVMQVLRDENDNVYDAQIRTFNDYKLLKQFRFESTSPSAYSAINAVSSTTAPGSPFREKAEYQYSGNDLVAIKRKDQPVETIVWDTDSRDYPIAIVMNAAPDKVLYTSFEYDDTNVTTSSARTGQQAYTASYTVTLPSAGTYNLTYWKKINSGPWHLITTTVSSNTSIGGGSGVLIDEVRLIPADATITTYTHRKGIGITSITDPNNITQYFIYDDLHRLKLVKDDKGNILKKNVYHYKGNAANE